MTALEMVRAYIREIEPKCEGPGMFSEIAQIVLRRLLEIEAALLKEQNGELG